jgi:DHA1 family multidrug resistance protein-like MFS transporter
MFQNLGIQWSLTLLGCLASLLMPVAVIFYFKGAHIRQISKYNPRAPEKTPLNGAE